MYIAFEGIDNVGKTTTMKVVSLLLKGRGIDHITVREPEGVMRSLIKNEMASWNHRIDGYNSSPKKFGGLSVIYSHVISHLELMANVVIPALNEGKVVLTDRNAYTSMIPYQVGGNGFERNFINNILAPVTYPDAVIFFDASPNDLSSRGRKGDDQFDSETELFRENVYSEYVSAYRDDKQGKWHRVNPLLPQNKVADLCVATILGILEDRTSLKDGSEGSSIRDYDRFYDAKKVSK